MAARDSEDIVSAPDLRAGLSHGKPCFRTFGCLLFVPAVDQLNDLLSQILVGGLLDQPLPWGPPQTEVLCVHCLRKQSWVPFLGLVYQTPEERIVLTELQTHSLLILEEPARVLTEGEVDPSV